MIGPDVSGPVPIQSLEPLLDPNMAILLKAIPVNIIAAWKCRVCKKVYARPQALIFWDGQNFFGLICESHTADEIESAVLMDPLEIHS